MGENFESLLGKVGGWGTYQKIVVPLICLFFLSMGFFVFTPVFTYLTPPHRCFIPGLDEINGNASSPNFTTLEAYIPTLQSDDGTWELSSCARYVHPHNSTSIGFNSSFPTSATEIPTEYCLDGWIYVDPEGRITATTEFNLVCSDSWKKPLLTSGLIIGLFLGGMLSGPITDKFGRRLSSLVNMVLHAILCIAFSFIPTYELLLFVIIVVGTSHMIWYSSTFVLVQELVDKDHRAIVACMVNVIYAVGYMILPGVGYLLTDWRWIYRSLGLASLIFMPYLFFLPESPRWLVSKNRNSDAYVIMSRIARVNGADVSVLEDLKMNNMDLTNKLLEQSSKNRGRQRRRSSVQILATNNVMRKRLFLVCWVWNVSFLCYYALGYNTSNLGGSNYWNCFVAAALEIPCYFFVAFSIQRFGRRSSVSAFIGLSGFFLALSPALAAYDAATITMAMLGKFFASSAMGILYLYTSELYPTLLRNTGLGIASMSSRLGSISAPFLVYAGENSSRYIPFYVMASLGLLTSVLCLFLPETKQSPLPDTMTDAIDLENFRIFNFSCKKSRRASRAALTGLNQSRDDEDESAAVFTASSEP